MTQQRQLVTTIQKDQQCAINLVTCVGSPLLTSDTTPNKDNWLLTGHWGTKHTHLLHLVTWVQLVFYPIYMKVLQTSVFQFIQCVAVSRIISPEKEHVLCYHR